jgi:leucyl-tRNA synthetase
MDLSVFTSRVDTIYGVTFLAIAPESAVVDALIQQVPDKLKGDVQGFVYKVKNLSKVMHIEFDLCILIDN